MRKRSDAVFFKYQYSALPKCNSTDEDDSV